MRILLVTPDYPPATGGIQLLCQRVVEYSRLDYEVMTLSADGRSDQPPGESNLTRTPRIGPRHLDIFALGGCTVGRAVTQRPDVVVSGHLVTGPAALVAQRLLGVPVVQFLYGMEVAARPGLARLVARRASAVMAISAFTRQQALSVGAPAERVHIIHPGVDFPETTATDASKHHRAEPPTVVTVARLEDRYKGFDVMISALPLIRAKVPDVRWVLIGEGSLREELKAMARSVGVAEAIVFAGSLPDSGRNRWLDRADVFAMPSRLLAGRGGEGFGIVYLEAGAHGLPCVAGNVDGAVDAVLDGETGLTVNPTDHVAVAEAISRLLLDSELRARLGAAGRAHAQKLTWPAMAVQVDDLVERVVLSGQPKP